jgi:hypothetical protein
MATEPLEKSYLTAAQVRQRYGNVSAMTLWRWLRDPQLGFPKPEPIRRRNYWKSEELDSWDVSRVPKAA